MEDKKKKVPNKNVKGSKKKSKFDKAMVKILNPSESKKTTH